MKNQDISNQNLFSSYGKKITLVTLLVVILTLSVLLQFSTGQATNQIIFFNNVELSTLGPISDGAGGGEILFPAEFNDEVRQEDVRVVGLANGTLLVGWDIDVSAETGHVPADKKDMFGKIYNADGTTITNDIQLYDYDSIGHSNDVSLTPTGDNGFYALWFKGTRVAVRKFDSLGVAAGPAQVVVTDTFGTQEPEMVELTNGNYMLTFRREIGGGKFDVGARLFDSSMMPLTEIMRTNEMTLTFFVKPNVAPLPDGQSMISWPSPTSETEDGILVQVFDASGAKAGANKQINQLPANNQQNAQIAPLPNGNVVIVYESREIDGTFQSVAGRVIDPSGNPVSDEFQVNPVNSNGFQQRPDVVGLKDNSFAVTWESFGGEEGAAGANSAAILVVQIDQTGKAISDEFVVNQSQAGPQEFTFISAISGTTPVVVWEGLELIDTNGDDTDPGNFQIETDGWMRILHREPFTTTQYTVGMTDTLKNEQVVLVGSEEVLTVTVQISANYDQGFDSLNAVVTGSVASNFDAATGTLTLSGSNSTADYAAVIKTISFESTTASNPAMPRTVTWSIYGTSGLLDMAEIEIVINQATATPTATFTPVSTETPIPGTTPGVTSTPTPVGTPLPLDNDIYLPVVVR